MILSLLLIVFHLEASLEGTLCSAQTGQELQLAAWQELPNRFLLDVLGARLMMSCYLSSYLLLFIFFYLDLL